MIPYFPQPSVSVGPLTIQAFGVIVAFAVFTGMTLGARRFRHTGLDAATGEGFAWWTVVGGFLGAHLFSVIFYFPEKVAANPLVLLKVWEDISSFGGILGGMLGSALFFRLRARTLDARARLAYLDVAAYAFPVSLMIGRLACALAHDHPGRVTTFPLAIGLDRPAAQSYIRRVYGEAGRLGELPADLPRYGFHDLGLYELLYLAIVVVPAILLLGRRTRRPGYFAVAFVLMYMPARIALDFLRVADARYAGMTPAQWVALAALLALAPLVVAMRRHTDSEAVRIPAPPQA